jgi:hypothetical protein
MNTIQLKSHVVKILFRVTRLTFTQLLDILLKPEIINFLKPIGHVMHHQFNIQQLHALPTLYLCVLYLPENKQRLVPLTA